LDITRIGQRWLGWQQQTTQQDCAPEKSTCVPVPGVPRRWQLVQAGGVHGAHFSLLRLL
jgi:hypothetical protein